VPATIGFQASHLGNFTEGFPFTAQRQNAANFFRGVFVVAGHTKLYSSLEGCLLDCYRGTPELFGYLLCG
jgi:hypothetical protein